MKNKKKSKKKYIQPISSHKREKKRNTSQQFNKTSIMQLKNKRCTKYCITAKYMYVRMASKIKTSNYII